MKTLILSLKQTFKSYIEQPYHNQENSYTKITIKEVLYSYNYARKDLQEQTYIRNIQRTSHYRNFHDPQPHIHSSTHLPKTLPITTLQILPTTEPIT
jgi:hypothetical protein